MIMAQFICPSCGAEYFLSSKGGSKTIFKVVSERVVEIVQSPSGSLNDGDIDLQHIFCGACSWQGGLDELVESQRD